jgi:hypothetical protein
MLNNSTRRGKHKIFIGMSPGVGKTYRMLDEAHRLKAEGIKVSCNVHERILLCVSTYSLFQNNEVHSPPASCLLPPASKR